MPTPLAADVLARLDRLEVAAKQAVEGALAGRHRSPRHGLAVEFAQHREYAPGDDIRHLDWRVYARSDRLHLKQYEQETNLVGWVVADASESMGYGSAARTKYDVACAAGLAVAYLVLRQADAVGLATVAGGVRQWVRASSQPGQLREAARALVAGPYPGPADLGAALHEVAGRCGRRGLVFVVSDLLDDAAGVLAGLQHLRYHKHEVVVLHTLDAAELDFPFRHTTLFRGLEGQPDVLTDPPAVRDAYLKNLHAHLDAVQAGCRAMEIDYVRVRTDDDLGRLLVGYLQGRRS